jgi:hypothetical protein
MTAPRIGAAVLLVGACLACWRSDVPPRERPVVLTARDLSSYGIDLKRPKAAESFKRTTYFDGSYAIEYEYSGDSSLFLAVTVDVEKTVHGAHALAASSRTATALAMRASGFTIREDSGARYKDESYFATMVAESSAVGHVVFVRQGTVLYSVILTGLVLSSPDEWRLLLDPKWAHLDSIRPVRR